MHNNACFRSGLGQKCKNLHFVSGSAERADRDPIGFGQRRLRQFGPQQAASAAVGNASAKPPPAPVALRTLSSLSSASASPNSRAGRVRLFHSQFQIGVGDLDAGPQQNPLASALGCGGPHRFQYFVALPEKSGIVQAQPVTQRRMARGHETIETRRHQRLGHRQRLVIRLGFDAWDVGPARQGEIDGCRVEGHSCGHRRGDRPTPRAPAHPHAPAKWTLRIPRSHSASPPAPRGAENARHR